MCRMGRARGRGRLDGSIGLVTEKRHVDGDVVSKRGYLLLSEEINVCNALYDGLIEQQEKQSLGRALYQVISSYTVNKYSVLGGST